LRSNEPAMSTTAIDVPVSVRMSAASRRITRVFHLAEAANWPSIGRHGVLSTQALLDLADVRGSERSRIERRQRQQSMTLPNGAIVRDQSPMPPAALARCLRGPTPSQWYVLLNSKVFFWVDPERLDRQRRACGGPQVVLVIDADALLARYGDSASVTPINTGNARRHPALRGACTFVPYAAWSGAGWESETSALGTRPRSRSHPPAELAIEYAVPDVMDFVRDVRHLARHESFSP
jgi:hypothetical protein